MNLNLYVAHHPAFSRGVAVALYLSLATAMLEGNPIVSRALPNSRIGVMPIVNSQAGANRVNTTFFTTPFNDAIIGDSFFIGEASVISSLTVFAISSHPYDELESSAPPLEFQDIQLFGGSISDPLQLLSNIYSYTRVQYEPGGEIYESNGVSYPIYSLTFSNLHWSVESGLYAFAVRGVPLVQRENSVSLALHASNAELSQASGVPQDGADGSFLVYGLGSDGYLLLAICNSGTFDCGPLWDKQSDINVIINTESVEGTAPAIPEPAPSILLAFGAAIALSRRLFGR